MRIFVGALKTFNTVFDNHLEHVSVSNRDCQVLQYCLKGLSVNGIDWVPKCKPSSSQKRGNAQWAPLCKWQIMIDEPGNNESLFIQINLVQFITVPRGSVGLYLSELCKKDANFMKVHKSLAVVVAFTQICTWVNAHTWYCWENCYQIINVTSSIFNQHKPSMIY